jgi:hypothetical protein
MATFDSGRQRYSMNFYASHQRPLQRRSYTGRPSRPAEGQLRVIFDQVIELGLRVDARFNPKATALVRWCNVTRRANRRHWIISHSRKKAFDDQLAAVR